MKKEYKLKDFFSALKVAKCQIKLLKGNENWDRRESMIMRFNIDLMLPWFWSRSNRGSITFREFTELKEVFECILPGISKANLKRIMYEARERKEKIRDRRNSYAPFKPRTGDLVKDFPDPYIKENRLCLDNSYYVVKRARKTPYWDDLMEKKYAKVLKRHLSETVPDAVDDYTGIRFEMYRNGDGKVGIRAKMEYRVKSSWAYKIMYITAREMIALRENFVETCTHDVVPILMPKSLATVNAPKGWICKKCKQYVESV